MGAPPEKRDLHPKMRNTGACLGTPRAARRPSAERNGCLPLLTQHLSLTARARLGNVLGYYYAVPKRDSTADDHKSLFDE